MLDRRPAARVEALRIESASDVPARDPSAIDVAVLDMNAGYPNVGHEAIVEIVRDCAAELDADLARTGRRLRVLSYSVRDKHVLPDHAEGRHRLYLGTGGPGHLDPRQNKRERGSIEIAEDPAWEAPLWRLFDAIAADERTALYGVCHTFGLICRWSGVAEPALRGPEKGGPMSGVGTNVLTPEALDHPWFGRLEPLAAASGVPVLDSRHYDLLPSGTMRPGATAIAFESATDGVGPGEALTMIEIARDPDGLPRIFAVNSHPEIGHHERVSELLARLLARGAIDPDVHVQRSAILPVLRDDRHHERLHVGRAVFTDLVHERLARLVRASH